MEMPRVFRDAMKIIKKCRGIKLTDGAAEVSAIEEQLRKTDDLGERERLTDLLIEAKKKHKIPPFDDGRLGKEIWRIENNT